MVVHPRTIEVEAAYRDLDSFITELIIKRNLTNAELLSILSRQVGNVSRLAIRDERHPNDDKAADEA